jgi:hypothetical protein
LNNILDLIFSGNGGGFYTRPHKSLLFHHFIVVPAGSLPVGLTGKED